MTVKVGKADAAISASLFDSFRGSATLSLVALGLLILMGVLTYGLVKIRKRLKINGNGENGNGGFDVKKFPATFETVNGTRRIYNESR